MRDGVLLCFREKQYRQHDISSRTQTRDNSSSYLRIPNYIEESNDIRPTGQVLQDLDFSLDLLLLDGLQNLDDAFLVVDNVDALENFRVLSAT